MSTIKKVAVFGASGNFGKPITAALLLSRFYVTIITRHESTAIFPPGIPVIRTEYTIDHLTAALSGQDVAISVVGPGGIAGNKTMIEAAEAAGLKRFIVNDFGWGPDFRSEPEFAQVGAQRAVAWDQAKSLAERNPNFTWTGITIGNPIDWAIRRFPVMGFNLEKSEAIIYDDGTEQFTGTTLTGIGQSVVGVLAHPMETANRFVKARSIQTCQTELLAAFEKATGRDWVIRHSTAREMMEDGKRKYKAGTGGWALDLLGAQLYEPGQARCIVASREESDAGLLEIIEETPSGVVAKALGL